MFRVDISIHGGNARLPEKNRQVVDALVKDAIERLQAQLMVATGRRLFVHVDVRPDMHTTTYYLPMETDNEPR